MLLFAVVSVVCGSCMALLIAALMGAARQGDDMVMNHQTMREA